MKSLSDQEIIKLLRESDYNAFNEIYERSWKYLFSYALRKTGDENDAFDLVQELYLEVWEKRASFPEISVPTLYYLRGILVFKLARLFRLRSFDDRHKKNFEDFVRAEKPDLSLNLIELEEIEREREGLIQAINCLIEDMPARMKEVFVLGRSGQYTISEIANLLGILPQTVKNQTQNALARLRTIRPNQLTLGVQAAFFCWLTN